MTRISLGYYIIAGLLIWGIPATFVTGPQAILYTVAASLPIWLICRRTLKSPAAPPRPISTATCTLLAAFSIAYAGWDAVFGRQLLQANMFLYHQQALDRVVDKVNESMSKGGGVPILLGQILSLLPFALIDASRRTTRYGRWVLWAIAILVLFYDTTTGRGPLLMAVVAIFLGQKPNWRRVIIAGSLGLIAFLAGSVFRGEVGGQTSMLLAAGFPFVNLGLMLKSHCGTAPWYSFLFEFLKKFVPAFLFPKAIFSFNLEMSLCIYPTVNNTVESVSIFTWLGEIFYYKPSIVTAVLAGVILGILARSLDRRFLHHQMHSSRLFAGLVCIALLRSRTQDVFTLLIAQLIFLFCVWPCLAGLMRYLRRLSPLAEKLEFVSGPGTEAP